MNKNEIKVKVWSEFGCFTSNAHKIERVSYNVPTPTACRGILESVYWHPQVEWDIIGVQMLNPIRYVGFTLNEVENIKVKRDKPIVVNVRQQRTNQVLYKPCFNIHAMMKPKPGFDYSYVMKGIDIFNRRIKDGRYFRQPFMGMSNFMAYIDLADDTKPHESLMNTVDLGIMLSDIIREPVFKSGKIVDYIHKPIASEYKMVNGYVDFTGAN
jgi:CRISPR-associated protein Cas5d